MRKIRVYFLTEILDIAMIYLNNPKLKNALSNKLMADVNHFNFLIDEKCP